MKKILFANGKQVGTVIGDTLYKEIRGSRHILRNGPSLCNDIQLLDDAEKAGAKFVQIYDIESCDFYCVAIETIREEGKRIDYDYGVQLALPLFKWARSLKEAKTWLSTKKNHRSNGR
jgi:hypothetical protein